jgi:2-methylisocitrate lyase-like PEP mutase family enzyme
MYKKSFRQLIEESDRCIMVPCVYDCASARAVEIVGFEAMMLSGGELSMAMNGIIEHDTSDYTECEWMAGRIAQSSIIPLAADIGNGWARSPIAIYRECRRLASLGVSAIQMEDSGDDGSLLPREEFYAKVRAAVDALKGTDCILIARTNGDCGAMMDECCARMQAAHELGAHMTTVVRTRTYDEAEYVARHVEGWKMFPDVTAPDGKPAVTLEQIYPLGYRIMTTHYTLKAAMDGMLEHGYRNFAEQNVTYTFNKKGPSGMAGFSAAAYFDPDGYMRMEETYTGQYQEYFLSKLYDEKYPESFPASENEKRF